MFTIKNPSGDNKLWINAIVAARVFNLAKMKAFATKNKLVFAH